MVMCLMVYNRYTRTTNYKIQLHTKIHVKSNWHGINVKAPITGKLEHLSCFPAR